MASRREPDEERDGGEDASRATRFGMEQTADSETSRGTTPVGHGSVEVTQDHEAARAMIMGETDDRDAGAREDQEPGRIRVQPEG